MPCDCSHMEASEREIQISRIACLLDELNGKKKLDPSHWDGYHPKVYGKFTVSGGDKMIAELCSRLQKLDVSKLSLEMQIWWRDHQEDDRKKLRAKQARIRNDKARAIALSKLSPYERRLLGL